jgi:hypothetical protein
MMTQNLLLCCYRLLVVEEGRYFDPWIVDLAVVESAVFEKSRTVMTMIGTSMKVKTLQLPVMVSSFCRPLVRTWCTSVGVWGREASLLDIVTSLRGLKRAITPEMYIVVILSATWIKYGL